FLRICFSCCSAYHPPLHSFPTRRSSDLISGRRPARAARRRLDVDHPSVIDDRDERRRRNVLRPRHQRGLAAAAVVSGGETAYPEDRKSTRLNSSHVKISYAVFCLKKTIW